MAKIGPEHALQVQISHTVRDHVRQPHFFFSVDRSRKHSEMDFRQREKARGLISGVPDTVLIYPGLPIITIELKAKGEKVSSGSNQERVGNAILAAGGLWAWCDSVTDYMALLDHFGVPLIGRWDLTAQHRDALLASAAIRRAEAKGVVSGKRFAGKPRAARASSAKVRANERVRSGVLF